jgi:hypothetical protein
MVAIVAFVGTAALAVVLTSAPGSTVASLSSEFSGPACAASGLQAWLGAAAADRAGTGLSHGGGTYYTLEFTNVSHQTCRLYGYPKVSAYQASPVTGQIPAAGSQIGIAAVRDTSVRPKPVMLAPGATAHAVLRVVLTASTQPVGCTQVTAEELGITLPTQGRPAFVPAHITFCSAKGSVSLSVQAIQARPGIPGYTRMP